MKNLIKNNSSDLYRFSLHPDLQGLIWIGDGEEKNLEQESKEYKTEYFTIRFSYRSEPSAIYTKLNISEPINSSQAGGLGYYPSYSGMSDQQRWKYLDFLTNPFNKDIDIGYVFVLYYGLERHLLKGNYQRAFEVVLKLRRSYTNGSFIAYSTCALIISSVINDRKDNIEILLREVNERNQQISPSTYMLMKAIIREQLEPSEVIKYHKSFELRNTYYIRKMPLEFIEELKTIMDEEENFRCYPHNYIDGDSSTELTLVFANISFETRDVKLPDLFKIENFIAFGNSLLQRTNLSLKQQLSESRSSKK